MFADLKGKTALVTGAGKKTGIGFGIAENLAANGFDVVVADLGSEGTNGGVVAAGSVQAACQAAIAADQVIEGTSAMVVELDGDPARPELLVTVSDAEVGARLRAYDLEGNVVMANHAAAPLSSSYGSAADQVGDLLQAGRTPGRPVVDYDPLATKIGQGHGVASHVRQGEIHFLGCKRQGGEQGPDKYQ